MPGGAIQVTLKLIIKGFGFPLPREICLWAESVYCHCDALPDPHNSISHSVDGNERLETMENQDLHSGMVCSP